MLLVKSTANLLPAEQKGITYPLYTFLINTYQILIDFNNYRFNFKQKYTKFNSEKPELDKTLNPNNRCYC